MTDFNINNKYVPKAPRTYEVRYVEYKELSNLTKFASYLGMGEACCSDDDKQVSSSSSGSVVKTAEDTAKIAAEVARAMSEVVAKNKGDKVESKTSASGETTTTYHSNK